MKKMIEIVHTRKNCFKNNKFRGEKKYIKNEWEKENKKKKRRKEEEKIIRRKEEKKKRRKEGVKIKKKRRSETISRNRAQRDVCLVPITSYSICPSVGS